jgi:hypothetical protein
MHHRSDDFDDRYSRTLPRHTKHAAFVAQVHQTLVDNGAPATCYVLAPGDDMDGMAVDLLLALQHFTTYGDAMISCIPGELGVYIGEDGHPVRLLQKPRRAVHRPI